MSREELERDWIGDKAREESEAYREAFEAMREACRAGQRYDDLLMRHVFRTNTDRAPIHLDEAYAEWISKGHDALALAEKVSK